MPVPLTRRAALATGLLAMGSRWSEAGAQDTFPSRPVHILVPYPAGGGVDVVTRMLGEEFAKRWNQSVIIENRPGAGGTIASQAVAKSPPDGYTLLVVASGHAINPFLYSRLPYDTFADFTPISLLASAPNLVLVRADSPMKSLADLLALAREKPGQLFYGMAGNGTSTHLAGELLKHLTKVDIKAVPYKGGAPAMNDLLGGHIPISINNAPEALGQLSGGAVRALGVTTGTRSPLMPEVPTIAEGGVPGYDTAVWWGLLGPARLPADVTDKIARDAAEALRMPTVRDRLRGLGSIPAESSPGQFAALIRTDHEKWGPIIKAAGIKGE